MENDGDRTCWVCYAGDKEQVKEWVAPCRCSGTTKWVHHQCLLRWINESRGVDVSMCPQCKTPYLIEDGGRMIVVTVGNFINRAVNMLAPIGFGFVLTASVWAGLSAYGAVTLMHVCGRDGKAILASANPFRLFMVMPAIPLILILVRVRIAVSLRRSRAHNQQQAQVQPANDQQQQQQIANRRHLMQHEHGSDWETDSDETDDSSDNYSEDDTVQQAQPNADALGQAIAAGAPHEDEFELQLPDMQDTKSTSRLVAGGLALPYIAAAMGRLLFRRTDLHPLDRSLLGGVVFLVLKGVVKHWYRICLRTANARKRVVNFRDEDR